MGRYRPPAEKSTALISRDGFARLSAELAQFWPKRREVTAALSAAAAEGDRSENAEYIYRKKQLREMDRRIGYLQRRIPQLRIVDQAPTNREQIFFAAQLVLLREDGSELRVKIVGPDEIGTGLISIDAPLARALLKRQVGDEVEVQVPAGTEVYEVLSVNYESPTIFGS